MLGGASMHAVEVGTDRLEGGGFVESAGAPVGYGAGHHRAQLSGPTHHPGGGPLLALEAQEQPCEAVGVAEDSSKVLLRVRRSGNDHRAALGKTCVGRCARPGIHVKTEAAGGTATAKVRPAPEGSRDRSAPVEASSKVGTMRGGLERQRSGGPFREGDAFRHAALAAALCLSRAAARAHRASRSRPQPLRARRPSRPRPPRRQRRPRALRGTMREAPLPVRVLVPGPTRTQILATT